MGRVMVGKSAYVVFDASENMLYLEGDLAPPGCDCCCWERRSEASNLVKSQGLSGSAQRRETCREPRPLVGITVGKNAVQARIKSISNQR